MKWALEVVDDRGKVIVFPLFEDNQCIPGVISFFEVTIPSKRRRRVIRKAAILLNNKTVGWVPNAEGLVAESNTTIHMMGIKLDILPECEGRCGR